MKTTKTKAMILTGALALAIPFNALASTNVGSDIDLTSARYKTAELSSDFVVAALSKEGKLTQADKDVYLAKLKARITSKNLVGNELSKTIIALRAVGADPTNIEGQNLVKKLYEQTNTTTLTGYAYALIALDTADYPVPPEAPYSRETLLTKILAADNDVTGAWGFGGPNSKPDIDTTGMVLTSLAEHMDNKDVDVAVDKAVDYLETQMKDDGGFDNYGVNSMSTAQIVIGLSSVGIDPTSGDFSVRGKNPVTHLLSYRTGDGLFKWKSTETVGNAFATEQVYQGLVAYNGFTKGDTLYQFDFPKVEEPTPTEEEPTPTEPSEGSQESNVVIDNQNNNTNNNNNSITITLPANGDVSNLPVSESVKETIKEVITNNNTTSTTNTSGSTTSSQPQIIVIQQTPDGKTTELESSTKPVVTEVKEESTGWSVDLKDLGIGAGSVALGSIGLFLRRKFLGA
jgi:hypothetical protein